MTSNQAVRIYALPEGTTGGEAPNSSCHTASDKTEELVHDLGALYQYWPDLSPVDDFCCPGAGVASEPGDLLNRRTGSGQQAYEAGPKLSRRPRRSDSCRVADGLELTPDVTGPEPGSERGGEHQAVILPQLSGGQPPIGLPDLVLP